MRLILKSLAVFALLTLTSCGDSESSGVEDALWLITEIPAEEGQQSVADFADLSFIGSIDGAEPRAVLDAYCGEIGLGFVDGPGDEFAIFDSNSDTEAFAGCANRDEIQAFLLSLKEAQTWTIADGTLTFTTGTGSRIVAVAASDS